MKNIVRNAARERYHSRLQRVLDHIDQHLDDDLALDVLSRVAAFSKHHFHRQFTAIFGVSVHRYVQLARIKRASHRLAFDADKPITDIAMDAGYESPEAFARAFKRRIGQSPSEFRKIPDWGPWFAAFGPLNEARCHMKKYFLEDVQIIDVQAMRVAVIEHRGDPARLGDTIQRFIAFRKASGLPPKTSATFTIFHDPAPAKPEDFHIDLCAGSPRPIAGTQGINTSIIPAGRCAVLRIIGPNDDLSAPAMFLYRDWLPASGEQCRDFPLYCQRVSFFPEVAEHEAVTDLFLPLKSTS
jgi:AraC family transcriptional regulator